MARGAITFARPFDPSRAIGTRSGDRRGLSARNRRGHYQPVTRGFSVAPIAHNDETRDLDAIFTESTARVRNLLGARANQGRWRRARWNPGPVGDTDAFAVETRR